MPADDAGHARFRAGHQLLARRGPRCGGGPTFEPRRSTRTSRGSPRAASTRCACFLLWEASNRQPDRVDAVMLERWSSVADAAGGAGLALMPTLFTGHMSGVDWIPAWALGGAERDARFRVVSGGRVVPDGCATGTRTTSILARRCCWRARRRRRSPGTRRCGRGTSATRTRTARSRPIGRTRGGGWRGPTGAIRSADPAALGHDRHPHGGPGAGPAAGARGGRRGVRLPHDARLPDLRGAGRTGRPTSTLVPFLARVTRWLGGGARRAVLRVRPAHDGPDRATPARPAARRPRRRRRATRSACSTGFAGPGCTGAMLWCYGDYDPGTWTDLRSTRRCTSVRSGCGARTARPKPAVEVVGAFAGATRSAPAGTTAGSTSTPSGTGGDRVSSSRDSTAASRRRRPARCNDTPVTA